MIGSSGEEVGSLIRVALPKTLGRIERDVKPSLMIVGGERPDDGRDLRMPSPARYRRRMSSAVFAPATRFLSERRRRGGRRL